MKLVIATTNPGKLREVQMLLAPLEWVIISLSEFPAYQPPAETGQTFAQNARIKAQAAREQLGLPTLADDSGLEVDALGGEPGVHSARWFPGTDADRSAALLKRLEKVPLSQRTARFKCALSLVTAKSTFIEVEGVCEGIIALSPQGENGFGYDPVFQITSQTLSPPEVIGQTMAQLSAAQKGQISHRARAANALLMKLNIQEKSHECTNEG